MIISKEKIKKIKEIIENGYKSLSISVLGKKIFSESEIQKLKNKGFDISNETSLLELIYNHNYLNIVDKTTPKTIGEMKKQQSVAKNLPKGTVNKYAIEHAEENTGQLFEKLSSKIATNIEGIIREGNNNLKISALQNKEISESLKEKTIGEIKTQLRDISQQSGRDFRRIAVTETSNLIGTASADRIAQKNTDKNLDEVYSYRVIVQDHSTCLWCRRFYLDSDGTPKVYRLSTLLANGSNYGKKNSDWKPVVTATHPNERCSQVIEMPPGYQVVAGGRLTYIGLDKWKDYIAKKVSA